MKGCIKLSNFEKYIVVQTNKQKQGITIYNISNCYPPFYYKTKEGDLMSRIKLETIQDAYECYGQENLVPIDLLKQIIFYTSKGVQPVFTCESEKEERKGQLVCWFLKSETQWVYKKWKENRPQKTN